jgi:hypothetical protein
MSILLVYRPRGVNFAFLGDMSVIDSRQRNFDTLEHGRLRMQRQHWLKEEATKSIFHETFFFRHLGFTIVVVVVVEVLVENTKSVY